MWKTVSLLICSIIQVFGVLIEGIARILMATAKLLEKAHDRVLDWQPTKKKEAKKVHIDVAL
jgi:hypothetical protein